MDFDPISSNSKSNYSSFSKHEETEQTKFYLELPDQVSDMISSVDA